MRDAPDPRHPVPRAIFLDALGTLIALAPPWPELVRLLAERHAVIVDHEQAREAMLAEMRHYRSECVRAGDAESLARLRDECAEIVIDRLGPPAAGVTPGALVPTLLDALRFELFDDVRPALERWRSQGSALYVVSNWDISLHDVARETGLDRLVDGVLSSAEVAASKPDPAIFVAALARAGVRPDEVVHIGDSLAEDVAGARAAGLHAVLLDRRGDAAQAPKGLRVIATLLEW
jgi:putative hydrolase of the HAD superfamily